MPPRIAISLGASFLGYATHAGFMARLHELGVRPVKVAGASAGAIAAGLYASGLPQERIKEEVLRLWLRLSFIHGTTWFIHQLRSFFWSQNPSFFNPRAAVIHMKSVVGEKRIEDLSQPKLSIALTRLDTHKPVLAVSGSLAEAMITSCCVPVLFAPLEFNGALCVDGGVSNEVPVDQWFEDDEVDLIIAHRISSTPTPRPSRFPENIIGVSGDAHETTSQQLMRYRMALAEKMGKKIILVDTVHTRPSMVGRDLSAFYQTGVEQAQVFYDSTLRSLLTA